MEMNEIRRKRDTYKEYSYDWKQWDNKLIELLENMGDETALVNAYRVRRNNFKENSHDWKQWDNKINSLK